MSTTSEHNWLRRVSDYHSGGLSADEEAAVEEHLASCEECRQALVVYRRFYVLVSSPLHLGEPSSFVDERLSMSTDAIGRFTEGDRVERHIGARGNMHPERNRRLLGIASVLAASLIIVGFLSVLGPRIGSIGKPTTPTPYPSATPSGPTPTVQVTSLPSPGTGYTNAGPDWAIALAVAPSSPTTMYACGEVPLNSGPLMIAVSNDGGHTWQPRTSPGKLSACDVTVDPTDPRDLALVSWFCSGLINTPANPVCEPHTHLYRSYNGGQTWSPISTPGGDWIAPEIAWIGSTLFIGTTEGVARSTAGGPLTLLRQSFFGTTSEMANARRLFAIGNTLIVQDITCGPDEGSTCSGPTARSVDLGAHWSLVSMNYRSNVVVLEAVGGDGKTLIGSQHRTFLRSLDGGATWSALPPAPTTSFGYIGVFETPGKSSSGGPITEAPDGSFFTTFDFPGPSSGFGSPSYAIYELAPGAKNWRYLAPLPGSGDTLTLLWNSAGHLAAIWGERGSPSVSGFQYRLF